VGSVEELLVVTSVGSVVDVKLDVDDDGTDVGNNEFDVLLLTGFRGISTDHKSRMNTI